MAGFANGLAALMKARSARGPTLEELKRQIQQAKVLASNGSYPGLSSSLPGDPGFSLTVPPGMSAMDALRARFAGAGGALPTAGAGLGPLAPPDAVSGITGQQGPLSPAVLAAARRIFTGRPF